MFKTRGYPLGRLMAVLEHMGVMTEGLKDIAFTDPARGLVPVWPRLAREHKLTRTWEEPGLLDEIMSQLPMNAFDGAFSVEEQGEFALGYWHQKGKLNPSLQKATSNAEPLTATMIIRLEPTLKAWAIEQGGSELVRTLLRKERYLRAPHPTVDQVSHFTDTLPGEYVHPYCLGPEHNERKSKNVSVRDLPPGARCRVCGESIHE